MSIPIILLILLSIFGGLALYGAWLNGDIGNRHRRKD